MDFSKPRVAIYYFVTPQTGYRNDGPPLFANVSLRKILHNLSDLSQIRKDISDDSGNVVHLWPINKPEDFGKFDLHILVDHGEDAIGVPLDWEIPHPSVYWVSDAHLGYDYRLNRAKQFDFVFCAQPQFIDQFARDGIPREKLFFLPHAFEPLVYKPSEIIKCWDWVFIGHLNSRKRIQLLDRLCKEFPSWYLGWRMPQTPGFNVMDDVAWKFSQGRVIVNDSIKDDLNMRVFETLGTRGCLLTDNISPLSLLFKDGEHLVAYESQQDAVDKMRWLLDHPTRALEIAESGYREALRAHTYEHRARTILLTALGWASTENPNVPSQTLAHSAPLQKETV